MSGKHNIDGGTAKEDHVATYTPIHETDTEFRSSKASLSKSKEKLSADGAEEKLLQKEDQAKIVTRVDMADAKYVVGDHRNGDAKIELDANKKQFSGLTKEELLKYADDPFWVRLRWFMFIMFWALWLCMLAGAIIIIVRAPKCSAPPPKTWYEIGALADRSSDVGFDQLEAELSLLQTYQVQGIFMNPCADTYDVLESPTCLDKFKEFVEKAKKKSIKVIVDLTANFVSTSHKWFEASVNRSANYTDFFVWAKGKDADETGRPKLPNNWVGVHGEKAWSWNDQRQEYYLHQYGPRQADLNFHNPAVVATFDRVLRKYMEAGAAGVRLIHARHLLVNESFADETMAQGVGAVGTTVDDFNFLWHTQTIDQPNLYNLLAHWSAIVAQSGPETVFTIAEDGVVKAEWYKLRSNFTMLRPPSAAPRPIFAHNISKLAEDLEKLLSNSWPALQLQIPSHPDAAPELAKFSVLLPASPVLGADMLVNENDTAVSETFSNLMMLRGHASIQHGARVITTVPAANTTDKLLACARWKAGQTGYIAVFNPGDEARANLTSVPSLPGQLSVHHISSHVRLTTNYTVNQVLQADDVTVPSYSTIVLSYVPKVSVEQ